MGGMVEQQLANAVTALIEGDSNLGVSVGRDDFKVNGMEVSIDEECSRILATRAPAAGDLRLIVAIIKTITDLERIGDEGEKIGYIASRLATMERPADKYREIKHLGRIVSEMVHQALDAFARMDGDAALRVARQDRVVDEEYESIQRQCITFMMEDPRSIRRALDVMWIVRALERIGDHAKNICEYVIYMVHGKDVRHTKLEDVERDLRKIGHRRRLAGRTSLVQSRAPALRAAFSVVAAIAPGNLCSTDVRRSISPARSSAPACWATRSTPRNISASSPVRCACSSASASARSASCSSSPACIACVYHGAIVYGGFIFVAAGAATWVAGRHVWIQASAAGHGAGLRRAARQPAADVSAARSDPQGHDRRRGVRHHRLDVARPLDAGLGADRARCRWASSASSTTPSIRCARAR